MSKNVLAEDAGMPAPANKSRFWQDFLANRLAAIGLLGMLIVVILSVFAPAFTPYTVDAIDFTKTLSPPSSENLFGTDRLGRDVFTRILYGGRISLLVAVAGMGITCVIGVLLGALAGYFGGKFDVICVKFAELFLAMPQVLIVITIAAIFGPSLKNLIFFLGFTSWPGLFRITRGQYLSLKKRDFVSSARVIGASHLSIIFRHILPNAIAPILVNITLLIAQLILMEAGLSFLGLGVQQPTPSWGNMLTAAQSLSVITDSPWQWIPAGGIISFTALSVNFIGDGLRDALDPHKL